MSRDQQPPEQEAVRTTIVGGRPPGSGMAVGPVPRGIEVLVKKAAVDPSFKQLLMAKRAKAADEISLKLEPAEITMLDAVPAAQLKSIIANTDVSEVSRAAFLGRAAAVMLAALTATTAAGCAGNRPDGPKLETPDQPEPNKEDSGKVAEKADREVPTKPDPKPTQSADDAQYDEWMREHTLLRYGARTLGHQPDRIQASRLPDGYLERWVDVLVKLLSSPDEDIRTEARNTLLAIGPAALPALKAAKMPNASVGKDVERIIEGLEAKAKASR